MNKARLGTPKPYRKAFGIAGVFIAAFAVIYSLFLKPPGQQGFDEGQVIGTVAAPFVVSAAITGFWASCARNPWSLLRIGIVLVLFALAALALSIFGQVSGR